MIDHRPTTQGKDAVCGSAGNYFRLRSKGESREARLVIVCNPENAHTNTGGPFLCGDNAKEEGQRSAAELSLLNHLVRCQEDDH